MNDSYDSFCDAVCAEIQHATAEELIHVKRELTDHMEDHAQALIELGRSPEEAKASAVAAMGDAIEIGRELDKEFPLRWFLISRVAVLIAFVLIVLIFSPLHTMVRSISDNHNARNVQAAEEEQSLDIRIDIPGTNDVVRIYSIRPEANEFGAYYAWVNMCCYDRSPTDTVGDHISYFYFLYQGERWRSSDFCPVGFASTAYRTSAVPVDKGQEYVTAVYERYGETIVVDIPLDWEGIA